MLRYWGNILNFLKILTFENIEFSQKIRNLLNKANILNIWTVYLNLGTLISDLILDSLL